MTKTDKRWNKVFSKLTKNYTYQPVGRSPIGGSAAMLKHLMDYQDFSGGKVDLRDFSVSGFYE